MGSSITLRAGRDKSVRRRHPWVFSGAIARVDGDPQLGDTIDVRAADGEVLGRAAFSPASQIRARMWTFGETDDETNIGELIARRIADAAGRRAELLASGTDSARLVFSEADGVPGVIADRYGDTVVCQLTTAGAERWRDTVFDALAGLDGVRTVHERSDADARKREGLQPRDGNVRGEPADPDLVAHEGRWRFAVDAAGGHKTGFYLDQRHARRAIEQLAPGRRVLNVFAYTGAFSVIAAGSGAATVSSVDSSGPALRLARRNAELNGVDVGELVEADAFTHLRGLRDRARQHDLIVLDPPKLAATQGQLDKATRAYKDLNLLAIKLLAPGGVLLTFSCSAAMTMDLFQKVVAGAALDARRDVAVEDRLHQPSDHPVPLSFPEAEYLKGLVLRAR
ncbi:MAG: class I SAM-dependent rRNA methyltransferase [Ilumatobacteraceae bacterium]